MSECNCSCCCAYLTPPWWVTMGFVAPGAHYQQAPTMPQNTNPATQPPSATGGTRVAPPPTATTTTTPGTTGTAAPPSARPNPVATIAGDLLKGDPVSLISDLAGLL